MDRADLLDRYHLGYQAVAAALAGLSDVELDRRPAGGGWTPREVAHHLPDSETNSYVRLRRLVAEDQPQIIGYDQDEWARRLHYGRPIAGSLAVLRAVRDASLQLLMSLSAAEWAREGTHSDDGRYSVDQWLLNYATHPYDHADQIRAAIGR